MDTKRGVFIVIEGSDGSGKATQVKLIKERLEAAGYDVELFDFPQYDQPSSYFVRRYLEGVYGSANEVGPYTSSLFYALDRFEAAPRIRQALSEGKIVLSNRFTGSSMAHQGTKIPNAEYRRGFFIWLDNLEFELLRIPRPDVSIILRVPADFSEQLLLKTGKKKDIHENDRIHLERTVLVFDDMAQLFPQDFQRLDCVRGGELLGIETINNMLWEKISPLLPPPTNQPKKRAKQTDQPEETAADIANTPAEKPKAAAAEVEVKLREVVIEPVPTEDLVLEDASGLLVQKIERFIPDARVIYPEKPSVHQPHNLIPAAQKAYEAKTSTLLGLYAKIIAGLTKKGGLDINEARTVASAVLPVGISATVQISPNDPNLESLIATLINDPLPELQAAGASLLAQAIKQGPTRFTEDLKPAKQKAVDVIAAIADEFLAENALSQPEPVTLVAAWPRNENELIADILYSYTGLPLRTVQERIMNWPMGRKLDVLEAYLYEKHNGSVLERAHYSWDLLTPYSVFRELQRYQSEALAIQTLTPRHGYDAPKAIEYADLTDTYEKCFDVSLELYSDLQTAGHYQEAQYATLHGHSQRWKVTLNAIQLSNLPDNPTTKAMREKQAEIHPAITDSLAVNC
jgi:dTMP kinase